MKFILVHGSWHAGWCWKLLSDQLIKKGHSVTCIDLPGHGKNKKDLSSVSYKDYFDYLEQVILQSPEPIVLVAHSMSGIIAAPMLDHLPDKIAHLYLIAAWVPQNGETLMGKAIAYNNSQIVNYLAEDSKNKTHKITEEGAKKVFYSECSPEIASWAIKHIQPQPLTPLVTPIKWKDSKIHQNKRTYLICENDLCVNPLSQRDMLKHYPSHSVVLNSGHFPFLSQPEKLAEILDAHI